MKKNGFTLVELIGVLIVLGLIALIVFPNIKDVVKESKQKVYDEQVNAIETNAKKWGAEHTSLLPDKGTYYLNLNELVTGGYLSQSEVKDPRDESIMNGCIIITNNNNFNQYQYEYVESSCEENRPQEYIVGEAVTFDPGDGISTNWNVIKDNGDTVVLMLNQNIGEPLSWYMSNKDNSYGPTNVMIELNERTINWTNVDPIAYYEYINNENTEHHGYQRIMIANGVTTITAKDTTTTVINGTTKARIITGQELKTIINDVTWTQNGNVTNTAGPDWLKANFDTQSSYWTLTTQLSNIENIWVINEDGILNHINLDNSTTGIRPVIEISKEKLIDI